MVVCYPMKGYQAHIYFSNDMGKKLKQLAKINRRSISAEVVIAVEAHLALSKPTLLLDAAKKASK